MINGSTIFIIMVFVTVLLLFQGMVVPVFGESAQVRKRLKERLKDIERKEGGDSYQSLLRDKYLKKLTPLERMFEKLGPMESLGTIIEQAGHSILAYRFVLFSLIISVTVGYISWIILRVSRRFNDRHIVHRLLALHEDQT